MGVRTVADINNALADGSFPELMLVQEALQEKKIAEIAENIIESGKRIILIAGPSSSGKTTFSHRLSISFGPMPETCIRFLLTIISSTERIHLLMRTASRILNVLKH